LVPGRSIAVCLITELGFPHVACALGSTMSDARTVLAEFLHDEVPPFHPMWAAARLTHPPEKERTAGVG
jgi:hypothetical protein